MFVILYKLALFSYSLAVIFFFLLLFSEKKAFPKIANLALGIGFSFHTLGFVSQWVVQIHFPILGIKGSLSFLAWLLSLIYLCLYRLFRISVLGSFFTPLILALMLLSRVVPVVSTPAPPFRTYWLLFHITTSLLGDALLAVAFCAGIMYLFQEKRIKKKKITSVFSRFPSLFFLDTLNYHALLVGFVLLSIGLLSGAVYAQWVKGKFWNWDPKEIWSLITWLVYAILMHQRVMLGWRGRQAAWLSIIGFCLLIFTFLGVNYLFKGYHHFG